ncbi:hypothetical protein LTR22_016910 [Elasticomyces elasticus]|nr:hypothetical protein LTR22_016910 [Elasticomyces elasticus]
MQPTRLALYALVGTTLFFILKPIINALRSPLRHIPGPFAARFTRLWYLLRVRNGQFHQENIALHQKYNSNVIRYAPNSYSISDPEAIKTIYSLSQGFPKSDWYAAWSPTRVRSLFTIQDNKVHGGLRRKFQSTYSMSSMVSYEAFTDQCTAILRRRLTEHAESGKPMDMAWWFQCFAVDTVAMITSSKRFGGLDAGEDIGGFTKALHGGLAYASQVGIYNEWHLPIVEFMAQLKNWGLSKGTPRMYLGDFIASTVGARRKLRESGEKVDLEEQDENAPKDMLDKFLDANDVDPSHFSQGDIIMGLSGNVIAGSDTTAATLTALLHNLIQNPQTLNRLRDEIADASAIGRLSAPVTFKEAQEHLPYLQAVIQETLRVHPAVGLPLERIVPAGGVQICGHYFPEGSVVGVNAWVLHYDTDVYGPDAADFSPERWLYSSEEQLLRMRRSWLPFGLGSRTCIGKNISLLEMSKLVPELIKAFDFEAVRGEGWEVKNQWFVIPKSLNVTVKQRSQ